MESVFAYKSGFPLAGSKIIGDGILRNADGPTLARSPVARVPDDSKAAQLIYERRTDADSFGNFYYCHDHTFWARFGVRADMGSHTTHIQDRNNIPKST